MPPVVAAVATWVATTAITAFGVSLAVASVIYATTVLILNALITMAATAALSMLSKKPKNSQGSINQGAELKLKLDPTMPRQVLVGTTATGGSVVWAHTHTPSGSKVPNEVLKRVIALSDLPVDSLLKVKFGVDELTWSGALTSGSRVSCTSHFQDKTGGDRLYMTFYDGTQTTADPTMVANTAGLWTSEHIGRDIAYVVLEFWFDPDAFQQGEPELLYIVKGAHCYDDRHDGSKPARTGPQRLNDPTTWTWTENAAVITAQVMRGFYSHYNPDVLIFGVQAEERDLSDSMLLSAYNTCDQVIDRLDETTETRYRTALNLTASEAVANVLQDLQAAMDGRIIDRGGAITILPGGTRTPVLALTDEDIVWSEQKSWQPKASLEDLTNYITGTFVDGEGGTFQEKAFPTLSNPAWEADDGGQRFTTQVSFRAITSWGQVQRVTKRMHNSSRQQATVAFVCPIWAMEMEQGDWFTLSSTRWGFEDKYFEVQLIHITQELKCAIIAREVNPDDDIWEPVSDEVPRQDTYWNPDRPDLTIPEFVLTPYEFESVDGVKLPAILFFQDSITPAQGSIFIELQIGLTADLPTANNTALLSATPGTSVLTGHFLPDTSYSIRARSTSGDKFSDWSDWEAVTTTPNFIATFVSGLGDLATLDEVDWASQVTGIAKPQDNATVSHVYRQHTAPSTGLTVNDTWVEFDVTNTIPQAIYAWNGSAWIKGADITGLNTSLAILGQGPLATSSLTSSQVDNSLVPTTGPNRIRFSEFEGGTLNWALGGNASGLSGFSRAVSVISTYNVMDFQATATAAGQFVSVWTDPDKFPVTAGEQLTSTMLYGSSNGTLSTNIVFYDNTNTLIGVSTEITGSGTGTLNATFPAVLHYMCTVPAGATKAYLAVYITSQASGVMHGKFSRPLVTGVPAGQTAYPAYTKGPAYVDNADPTALNTAAAITGQQAWATAKISYQSSTPSSPAVGDIWIDTTAAPFKTKRWDGSAWVATGIAVTNTNQVTDGANLGQTASWPSVTGTGKPENNADVTSTHTSAAFSGQGGMATANYYYQSSDPGSVANGSIWTDTSGAYNVIKQRVSGSWVIIGNNNTASGGAQFYLTGNTTACGSSHFGASTQTTNTVTVTPHNNTSTVSYSWSVPRDGVTPTSPTGATTAFTGFVGTGQELEGTSVCLATDSGSGATAAYAVSIDMAETS